MPKKIQNCGKAQLVAVPLPAHGTSYTVISHESVIDMSTTALTNAGFTIVDEEYRATADGQIAQGIYKLNYMGDPELSMMFAWTNSYNKQVRFKCGVGAYVNKTGTVMVCGDMGSWARKHTGTADTETQETIDEQVANAYMYYNQLVSDKAEMEEITMNKRKQAQMLGILFAEYQILTTEQASMVRQQMDRPTHVFTNSNSLWAFYNYVTVALQHSHPKTWMEDQRILHMFISEINKFTVVNTPAPVIEEPVDPLLAVPNQTNILDQIAELELDENTEAVFTELATDPNVRNFSAYDEHGNLIISTFDTEEFSRAQLAGVRAPEAEEKHHAKPASEMSDAELREEFPHLTDEEFNRLNTPQPIEKDPYIIKQAEEDIKLVLPKTNEEIVAEYNATHDDSQINIEYLSPEEVKEKYGQDIVIHVESDEEYAQRVVEIEGEPEEEILELEEILSEDTDGEVTWQAPDAVGTFTLKEVEEETVIYTDPAGNTFETVSFEAEEIIEKEVLPELDLEEEILETEVKTFFKEVEESELDFDLDLDLDTEEDTDTDNVPDFF